MKAVDVYNKSVALATAATALSVLVDNATKQGTVDEHSSQSWYGLPGGVDSDIQEAYDLVILASNKLNTVLTTRQTLL